MRMRMPALLRGLGAAQGSTHKLQLLSANAKGRQLPLGRYTQTCHTRGQSMQALLIALAHDCRRPGHRRKRKLQGRGR